MNALSDILVISVIPEVELKALKAAFGIEASAKPNYKDEVASYWFTDVTTRQGPQRVALTCIGLQGSVVAASFTTNAIEATNPRVAFLVGICAGLKNKTDLGHVIASTMIIGYEPARLETKGIAKQPNQPEPPFAILQDLLFFDTSTVAWRNSCEATWQALGLKLIEDFNPQAHYAIIASGEKLIADGSLGRLKTEYHEGIRGGEKEGIGFASACRRRRREIPWLVIKGVSDFGGDDKDEKSDEIIRQKVAAANAAAFVRCFIEDGLVESPRSKRFELLDGKRDMLLRFKTIFIDDVGEGGEICLLSLVGGWPSFNPFQAIADALAKGNRLKVILSREALDDWARRATEEARRLLHNPLLDVRYISDFSVRYLRIGVNKKKNLGLYALYDKDTGYLNVEGFATREAVVVEAITAAFNRIFDSCPTYKSPS